MAQSMAGIERAFRETLGLAQNRDGRAKAWHRLVGLTFEPGVTLDAIHLQGKQRRAGPETLVLFLLPSAAHVAVSIVSWRPSGLFAGPLMELVCFALMPWAVARIMPPFLLLFDVESTANWRRWRTYVCHALVPILGANALAQFLEPFSWLTSGAILVAGYCGSARCFWLTAEDWVGSSEGRRGTVAAVALVTLVALSLTSSILFAVGSPSAGG
jgi:hypothetical protein